MHPEHVNAVRYRAYVQAIGFEVHHALRTDEGDPCDPAIIAPAIHARIQASEWVTNEHSALDALRATHSRNALFDSQDAFGEVADRPLATCETFKDAITRMAHAALTEDIAAVVWALVGE